MADTMSATDEAEAPVEQRECRVVVLTVRYTRHAEDEVPPSDEWGWRLRRAGIDVRDVDVQSDDLAPRKWQRTEPRM
jgi:hypothetical protein